MVWVRLDDGFSEHPKIAKVGAIGAWIQVQALCYSNRNMTDGFLPESIADMFGKIGTEHIGISRSAVLDGPHGKPIAEFGDDVWDMDWPSIMVDAGLWEVVDGGYLIHDFLSFNPSKKQILDRRKKDTIRKDSTRNPDGIRTESKRPVPGPVPGPVPVPLKEKDSKEKSGNGAENKPTREELNLERARVGKNMFGPATPIDGD